MPLILPHFARGALASLSACGSFCDAGGGRFHWLRDDVWRVTTRHRTGAGTVGMWISVERAGDCGHFHVDAGLESAFGWLEGGPLNYERVKLPEVNRVFERLAGLPVDLNAACEFQLKLAKLPKRGIVNTLIGLPTTANGIELAVSGIELQVVHPRFRSVRVMSRDTYAEVDIKTALSAEVSDEYLKQIADLGHEGLELLVLEEPGRPNDAARNDALRKQSPRIRRA